MNSGKAKIIRRYVDKIFNDLANRSIVIDDDKRRTFYKQMKLWWECMTRKERKLIGSVLMRKDQIPEKYKDIMPYTLKQASMHKMHVSSRPQDPRVRSKEYTSFDFTRKLEDE